MNLIVKEPETNSPIQSACEPTDMLRRAVKLMEVATDLTYLFEPEEVPAQVVAHLSEELRFQAVSVLLMDPQTRRLQYAADFGVPAEVKELGFRPRGTAFRTWEQGTPIFVEDMAVDPQVNPSARPYFKSYACLPITYRERHLGVLFVNYGEPHPFPETERQILRAFASATAVAMEKMRLRKAVESLERIPAARERVMAPSLWGAGAGAH